GSREFRRRLCELSSRHDGKRLGVDVTSQGRPKGGLGHLAVHLLHVGTGLLGERMAAALELRGADRALARAAGALLAPRLRAAAGDEAAALRRGGAGALRVQLGAHSLVHEMRPHLGGEDCVLECQVLGLLALEVQLRCLRHYPRTSTKPFLGPGIEPLTSSRFFSTSMSCTVSPSWVTRLPPMRPAILMPLKTRE